MKPQQMAIRKGLFLALALGAAACSPSGTNREGAVAATAPAQAEPASSSSAPSQAKTESRPRIVFLGDSLTAGLGLSPDQSIPSLMQARLDSAGFGYEVVNAGVSGDTSAGGLRRLDWSLDGNVEMLVVELGANDGLRGLPVAEMKRNIEQVITRAKERHIKVVLTGMEAPPNYGPLYTSEFRDVFKDLAKEQRVTFIPFFLEGVAGNPALNQGDGIHPNPEGARIVERTIWKTIEPLLDKQD
jgi:acyl-CoA thioesterase-1